MDTCIIKLACILRKIRAACFDNLGIHLNQVDTLDALISCQFLNDASVSCTDYEDVLNVGMH